MKKSKFYEIVYEILEIVDSEDPNDIERVQELRDMLNEEERASAVAKDPIARNRMISNKEGRKRRFRFFAVSPDGSTHEFKSYDDMRIETGIVSKGNSKDLSGKEITQGLFKGSTLLVERTYYIGTSPEGKEYKATSIKNLAELTGVSCTAIADICSNRKSYVQGTAKGWEFRFTGDV